MLRDTSIYETYQSPFSVRYKSEMGRLFSLQVKHAAWRKVWTALAEAEHAMGLPITPQQLEEMRTHIEDINFEDADRYEKQFNHDVMAHLHAYGDQCPLAKPVIHLGATSCLVTDNADGLIIRDAIDLVRVKLVNLIVRLADRAEETKDIPCLSYTHFQPAQPTTVGKRMTLWLQDFVLDLEALDFRLENYRFLGLKGATGTQASFVELFDGDKRKVTELEKKFEQKLGIKKVFPIAGQTYTRKQDMQILDILAGIAVSSHKMSTDLRLLAHLQEIEEPFGSKQIGSSAMPYKRNPMLNERVCSLARFVMATAENPKYTAATQWMERTLDDSANRRLILPEAFLATDALLDILSNLAENMVVNTKVIDKHLKEELPFLATENILMACVKKGGDRQKLHEVIREHSLATAEEIKAEGKPNRLIDRLKADPGIPLSQEEIDQLLDANSFVGRAPEQVQEYVESVRSSL